MEVRYIGSITEAITRIATTSRKIFSSILEKATVIKDNFVEKVYYRKVMYQIYQLIEKWQ